MKRFISGAMVGLVVVAHLAIPADAGVVPDIRGTKCAKVGTSRTVKRVSYRCTKSGRSLVWRAVGARRGKAVTTTTTTSTSTSSTTLAPTRDVFGSLKVTGGKRCVRAGDQIEATGYFGRGDKGVPTISMARVVPGSNPANGPVASLSPTSSSTASIIVTIPDIATLPNGSSTYNQVAAFFTWGAFSTSGILTQQQLNMCTEFATTGTTVPLSNRTPLIQTFPGYNFSSGWMPDTNTPGFQYGHFSRSQIGQSFVIERAMNLESILFLVGRFTTVTDIDVYNRTPEPDNHALETSDFTAEVPMRLRLSIWKSPNSAPLLNDLDTSRDLSLVRSQATDEIIVTGAPLEISLSSPLALDPGSYLFTIRLEATTELVKRRILTFFVTAKLSGNATRGGFDRSMDKTCSYTPGPDVYPNGKAYWSAFEEPYVDWQSGTSRNYRTLFTEMRAKQQECSVVGNYADIHNEGDIVMELRGTWR